MPRPRRGRSPRPGRGRRHRRPPRPADKTQVPRRRASPARRPGAARTDPGRPARRSDRVPRRPHGRRRHRRRGGRRPPPTGSPGLPWSAVGGRRRGRDLRDARHHGPVPRPAPTGTMPTERGPEGHRRPRGRGLLSGYTLRPRSVRISPKAWAWPTPFVSWSSQTDSFTEIAERGGAAGEPQGTIVEKVRPFVEPVAPTSGSSCTTSSMPGGILRVTDRSRRSGVDLEAIADVTRDGVARARSTTTRFPGRYTLEVSSPGLERPLRTPSPLPRRRRRHRRACGPTRTSRATAGSTAVGDGRRQDASPCASIDGDQERILRYDDIERARTVFEWGPAATKPKPGKVTPFGAAADDDEEGSDMKHRYVKPCARSPRTRASRSTRCSQALADALESAYKRMPGRRTRTPGSRSTPTRSRSASIAQELDEDGEPSVHELDDTPERLRPHRRADVPPGDDAAHPRGRARAEVRGVRRPRGRHRHRHHPAERQPLHAARPRARSRRCCPRPSRCPTSGPSPAPGSRPTSSRSARPPRARRSSSAAPTRASSSGCSSSRCPRSPTASSRSRPAPASPGTARRSPSGRTTTTSTRSAPASAPAAPASAWSSTSCAARRSTSSRSPRTRPTSWPRRCRRPRSRRSASTRTTGTAEVIVPDYQLSLAIGKEGQNARLAARLTGWRVDIKSETQLAEEEAYADRGVGRGRVGHRTPRPASRCGSRRGRRRPCPPSEWARGADDGRQ